LSLSYVMLISDGKTIPYGTYDVAHDEALVNVG
jgi:hypothetical protein